MMMTNNGHINSISVESLVELWADRYIPNLSTLPIKGDFLSILQLVKVATPSSRAATVAKVRFSLQLYYDSTWRETNTFFSYMANVVKINEADSLIYCIRQVYEKILEIYQQQSLPAIALLVSPAIEMPQVQQLSQELAPVLLKLQEQYLFFQDPLALGFITTPFHFSTKFILSQLTVPEQILLNPYLQFVEEQVSIPWQRVCMAAATYHPNSPTLTLVRQMLPLSQEIAETVYRQAIELHGVRHTRRGGFNDPEKATSVIRDLNLFQSYLWLCVLEESMAAVEKELIPLCVKIFPSIEVTWELVRQMVQLLVEELLRRIEPELVHHLEPYTQAMQQLFSKLPLAEL